MNMKFSGSLSRSILSNTTENIFWRGVEYARNGNVKDFQEGGKKISAKVVGTNIYHVEFRQGPKYTKGYCTCPYALNEDYCKHVVALAVYRDLSRGVEIPAKEEVQSSCVEIEYGFGKKIEAMFRDPLHADLELLARASDYSSWTRPHAKIPIVSPFGELDGGISLKAMRSALQKIARLERRSQYDPYFCAGEVSALLSMAYDIVIKHIEHLSKEEFLSVFTECIAFYYNTYLQMIDGSDGVWQIPFARLQFLFAEFGSHGVSHEEKDRLRRYLNERIEGWGDIFENLEFQFN